MTNAEHPDTIKSSIEMLTTSIVERNMTDDNDVVLPITFENVSQLPLSDIMDIINVLISKKKLNR
jgi:hypothetical protein